MGLHPIFGVAPSGDLVPSNVVFPENFGAVGDGVADDSTAFVSFLDAITTGVFGYGSLKTGKTYLLNTWVVYSNSVKLVIEGNGATVRGPAVQVDFLSPAIDFDIRNVVFDRWNSVVERLLAQSGSYEEFRFIDNTCMNCVGQVFNIERPVNRYWVLQNRFDTCSGGYAIKIGENTFANQDLYLKGTVQNNEFKTLSSPNGVSCAAIIIYGREVDISGNIIEDVSGATTGEGWGIYTKVRFGVIAHNRVTQIKSASSTDVVGINIKGAGRGITTQGPQGFNVLCHDNHVIDVGVSNVVGIGIRIQVDDVDCHDNYIEDAGLTGITMDSTSVIGGNNDCITHHNRIRFATALGTKGIRLEHSGDNVSVDYNLIFNAAIAISAIISDVAINDLSIKNNKLFPVSTGSGISFTPTVDINDCTVFGNEIGTCANGIIINAGSGTIVNMRIAENDLRRTTTKINGTVPAGTTLINNKGYMEGSATFNPADLADGAGETTSVTCTGAALGDLASASFSLDLQGITVTAYVDSANSVAVRFQNETTGTLNLVSGTLRVAAARIAP